MPDLNALNPWLERIAEQLDEDQKRNLNRQISQSVKRNWAKRIRSQTDPTGSRFTPRKSLKKRSQKGKLFKAAPRLLKTAYSARHAQVGFNGRMARIMEVHQFGLSIRPSPTARLTTYTIRQTVGFSEEDVKIIEKQIKLFLLNQ